MRRLLWAAGLAWLAAVALVYAAISAVKAVDPPALWLYDLGPLLAWDGSDPPPAVGDGWRIAGK